MLDRHSLIPPPGNAARPVFFLVAGFFGLMLVGYPIFMHVMGLGTTGIVWITLLILAVAIGVLWFTVRLGQNLEQDAERLAAGEVWAEWTVPASQYRLFLASERRSTNRRALLTALGGVALALGYFTLGDDRLGAAIMLVVFLLVGLVVYVFAGPPRRIHRDEARRVRIGPLGVHSMGRYLPLRTTMVRLRNIAITDGDPPVMRFTVRSGRRLDEIRVPVPQDQVPQAEGLAERLRREHGI